ncbi:MAG: hypothetical protein AMS22_00600 [Thiotrichales bacterium SG8_50]|nr:MAG: hypothetical protein AMS22_00600 [Thiotrichales bacterium SG8_50]
MNTASKLVVLLSLASLAFPVVADETASSSTPLNVGIGFGLNYGGLGVNAEYTLAERWGANGSIGYAGDHSGVVGVVAGVRYYLSTKRDFKPRLALAIGNLPAKLCAEGVADVCDVERITAYGASIGFRYKHFDLDVGYWRSNDIDDFSDEVEGSLNDLDTIDLSLGYRF